MVRPRELVKHCTLGDPVRVMQLRDIRCECLRVAGDVQDVVEATGQFAGVRVHAGAGRVDEDAAEFVALQIDALQATERAHFIQRLGEFFGSEAAS